MDREFRAMGTDWWLRIERDDASLLERARRMVDALERRLSRFDPGSALSRLNRDRAVEDAVLAEVVTAAEEMRRRTSGAFDVRVGAAVIAAGYDRSFEQLAGEVASAGCPPRVPQVRVEGTRVTLLGDGAIDLGGIAKGWTVDRVADLMSSSGACVVDGGGDIAVRGVPHERYERREGHEDHEVHEWRVGVGDGLVAGVRDAAVATSSSQRRRWRTPEGDAHHIIDPGTARPSSGVSSATVVARSAATADALATALVSDLERALPALGGLSAEALLQRDDGTWEMTPGMERYLR